MKKKPQTDSITQSQPSAVQRMTFELSINVLNYFKIVSLIYADIVLITQAEAKALPGAADAELNRAGSSWGPAGLSCCSQKRNDIPALMN